MKPGIRFTAATEKDLEAALTRYESQRPGLGAALFAQGSQLLEQLQSSPKAWPVRYRDLRRALIRRFPFALWYQASENDLLVIAVTHLRFGPRRTKHRLGESGP